MASVNYPAVLEPDAAGGYGVFFPDLDGCTSGGDSYEEAARNAVEALSLHLEAMAEDGEAWPERSAVREVQARFSEVLKAGGHVVLVETSAPDASQRVNVYLPKSLLDRVDRFAGETGINRSTVFALAARRYLDAEREGRLRKVD